MVLQIAVKLVINYTDRKEGDRMNKDQLFDRFTKELFKMEPINFMGVAHLFGVDLSKTNDKGEIDITAISYEVLQKFTSLSKEKQKEIVKLCKLTNKKDSDKNGNRSETK